MGEEKISETGIESLARTELGRTVKFQTFFEQVSLLLEENDPEMIARIREKSSFEFLKKLDEYVARVEQTQFTPSDITVNGRLVPGWFIDEKFKNYESSPVPRRIEQVLKDIEYNIFVYYSHDITAKERGEIKKSLKGMLKKKTLRALYEEFYEWLGKPELFRAGKNAVLEYSDVFPLTYLKIRLEGAAKLYENVKHLLVDEMQDYTPVQYAVISQLFPCKKTILGDMNQSVNPYSSSSAEEIQKVFTGSDSLQLCKSYRSSYEIIQFAQRISPNDKLIPIERHGGEPLVRRFDSKGEETAEIVRLVSEFPQSGYQTMGIICKTGKQAEEIHNALHGHKTQLLTPHTALFHQGVTVCAAYLAKGLEFDCVVLPHVSDDNYATLIDKNMLYVACTRAMHKLTLTFTGTVSRYIS